MNKLLQKITKIAMTVKQKLLIPIIILSLIICATFVLTWWGSSKQKNDDFVINLAGRQRMLTQKLTKEVLHLRSVWENDQKRPEREIKEVKNTIAVFNKTLDAFISSGDAPLGFKLDNNEYRYCPAATGQVLSQFKKVQNIWIPFSSDILSIVETPSDPNKRIRTVLKNNIVLLDEINKAVEKIQRQAEKRGELQFNAQIAGIIISLCFLLFGIIVVSRVADTLDTEITKHKQAEEKLHQINDYLDTILLNLPIGVAILEGPEFRYFRINKKLHKVIFNRSCRKKQDESFFKGIDQLPVKCCSVL